MISLATAYRPHRVRAANDYDCGEKKSIYSQASVLDAQSGKNIIEGNVQTIAACCPSAAAAVR